MKIRNKKVGYTERIRLGLWSPGSLKYRRSRSYECPGLSNTLTTQLPSCEIPVTQDDSPGKYTPLSGDVGRPVINVSQQHLSSNMGSCCSNHDSSTSPPSLAPGKQAGYIAQLRSEYHGWILIRSINEDTSQVECK